MFAAEGMAAGQLQAEQLKHWILASNRRNLREEWTGSWACGPWGIVLRVLSVKPGCSLPTVTAFRSYRYASKGKTSSRTDSSRTTWHEKSAGGGQVYPHG